MRMLTRGERLQIVDAQIQEYERFLILEQPGPSLAVRIVDALQDAEAVEETP